MRIHVILLTLFSLLPVVVHSAASEKLQAFFNEIDAISASFEQSVLNRETAETGRFQGTFSLLRPDRFRWDYSEPEPRVILADGETLYIIDEELDQVTYIPQSRALDGTPAGILLSASDLQQQFEIIDIGESQAMDWVELIPRDTESQFTRILIAFLGNELRRMEIADNFGQITRFQFYDVQRNPDFPAEHFVFERRQGYDMLMGEGY